MSRVPRKIKKKMKRAMKLLVYPNRRSLVDLLSPGRFNPGDYE